MSCSTDRETANARPMRSSYCLSFSYPLSLIRSRSEGVAPPTPTMNMANRRRCLQLLHHPVATSTASHNYGDKRPYGPDRHRNPPKLRATQSRATRLTCQARQLRTLSPDGVAPALAADLSIDRTWIMHRHQKGNDEEPDLPSNMIDEEEPPHSPVTDKELEEAHYRARQQDASYSSVELLQCFFDLFPPDTPVRIRHKPSDKPAGTFSYITTISDRTGAKDMLLYPKVSTAVVIDNPAIKNNF
jgi:hypothetical protein